MATYNWSNLKIEFDNTGGSLVDVSAYVLGFNGVKIKGETQDVTPAGWQFVRKLFAGLKSCDDITLDLLYDDTATTGPDAIFNAVGETRSLKITWGGSKTTTTEWIIAGYDRLPTKGQMTQGEATLTFTGTAFNTGITEV